MGALHYNQLATLAWGGSGGNDRQRHNSRTKSEFDNVYTLPFAAAHPVSDNVHQIGTSYSSNFAGDGPEKTRDRKSWFPRFKSNWLGTFRSKQMFFCCECAVLPTSGRSLSSQASRYKGAEGKHCRCGKDQWHLAKSVEETEYNRRMAISKALGGMRYDEAVQCLQNAGQSKLDFKQSELISTSSPTPSKGTRGLAPSSSLSSSSSSPKRVRSVSSGPLPNRIYAASNVIKSDLSTLPLFASHVYEYVNPPKQYNTQTPVFSDNGIEYTQPQHPLEYEHLTPASFGDEESSGHLLHGILEDEYRVAAVANTGFSLNQTNALGEARCGYVTEAPQDSCNVTPLSRTVSMSGYATMSSFMASPLRAIQDYNDSNCRASSNNVPALFNYHHHAHQQQSMSQHQFPYQPQQ